MGHYLQTLHEELKQQGEAGDPYVDGYALAAYNGDERAKEAAVDGDDPVLSELVQWNSTTQFKPYAVNSWAQQRTTLLSLAVLDQLAQFSTPPLLDEIKLDRPFQISACLLVLRHRHMNETTIPIGEGILSI